MKETEYSVIINSVKNIKTFPESALIYYDKTIEEKIYINQVVDCKIVENGITIIRTGIVKKIQSSTLYIFIIIFYLFILPPPLHISFSSSYYYYYIMFVVKQRVTYKYYY